MTTTQKPHWSPLIILTLVALVAILFSLLVMEKATDKVAVMVDGEVQEQRIYRWRMVTTWPKDFPGLGTTAQEFANMVQSMSGGRLQIRVYGAGEIVPAMGVFDAVSDGSAEMGHGGSYYWRGKAPAAQFFTTIPFGMNAQEMNAWLHHGGGLELWREVYAPFNIIPFPGGNTGIQMAGWFNKEINNIEDLRGLKMRIPGLAGDVFNRAGGSSVNIPGGELYTSLQTGVIDAAEWVGPSNDQAFGFDQIARYYYYPGWQEPGSTLELLVNKPAFEALPKDLQAIVTHAARAANQDMLDQYTARNPRALNDMVAKEGTELRRLPDDVIQRLYTLSRDIFQEQAERDPLFRKVWNSYRAFLAEVTDYHKITEHTYYDVREQVQKDTASAGEGND
ncbi:TRAP transporter substrate-binding protein DctP [Marinimicrobium sp. C6131]|uniref:TRAP transporter substrate-binding protein n=1 Tax=Marinimicrobium sp. C6131 TaxID=3022676 RepID=UPI00223CE5DA|nr:TRAP transporter substrate-binding protein DctP [Marinimicrobium sp. C6131]UZJ43717.1 TRAP transporter substrate-binding protein DctP [Marinimicrobium sp. C6131]